MCHKLLLTTLSLFLLLAACTSIERTPTPTAVTAALNVTAVPPTRTVPPIPTATTTPTEMPTDTAVPTQTNTPEPTPTVPIWVAAGTAVPQPSAIISPENAHQLTELARWGRGVIDSVDFTADGQHINVTTATGMYTHNTNNLDEIDYAAPFEVGVLAPSG